MYIPLSRQQEAEKLKLLSKQKQGKRLSLKNKHRLQGLMSLEAGFKKQQESLRAAAISQVPEDQLDFIFVNETSNLGTPFSEREETMIEIIEVIEILEPVS